MRGGTVAADKPWQQDDMRLIEFPKFLLFEMNDSTNTPLTTFMRIFERRTLDHGLQSPQMQASVNESFDSNGTNPTSIGTKQSEVAQSTLPPLVYLHLEGHFVDLQEGGKPLDKATI